MVVECGRVDLETLRSWLVEGSPHAETLVGSKWIVDYEETDENGRLKTFRAILPKLPLTLLVLGLRGDEKGPYIARLVVETPIDTIDMDPRAKVKLYRRLLSMNKMALAKYYLYGEDNTVAIVVDLDLKSLSKEEFEDALGTLLMGFMYLSKLEESFAEMLKEKEIQDLGRLVLGYLEKGRSKDEIIRMLIEGGMSGELAKDIVDTIYRAARGETPEKPRGDLLRI